MSNVDQPDCSSKAHEDTNKSNNVPECTGSSKDEPNVPIETEPTIDALLEMTNLDTTPDVYDYEPLRTNWYYNQPIFARYKQTPYFFSGNIATYLGAGLYMIVFDDGSLNYRVRREDILLRPPPIVAIIRKQSLTQRYPVSSNEYGDSLVEKVLEQGSLDELDKEEEEEEDKEEPMMVDFSFNPPRQITSCTGYDVADEPILDMKKLECGVAYEDDSTQVSDSDDSDEDHMMTPWQQMTQTFIGGRRRTTLHRRSSRRSSISSVSQIEHNKGNGMNPPKTITQLIKEYWSKKTTKIQPSIMEQVNIQDVIRRMEILCEELRIRYQSGIGYSGKKKMPLMNEMKRTGSAAKALALAVANSVVAAEMATIFAQPGTTRVVFQRENGTRCYGTIKSRLPNGNVELIVESEHGITIYIVSPYEFDFLPNLTDLEAQIEDLQQLTSILYAGRKVHVNLYPGTRFSGPGVITLVNEAQNDMYDILLQNRTRLVNVPKDKFTPLKEKKKELIRITENQSLICANKVKVRIGDQVYVRVPIEKDAMEYEPNHIPMEEKLGVLNGVYSNQTAAIDFADGSTGYEIPPESIIKLKTNSMCQKDSDLMSLKNEVLMNAAVNGSIQVDVGYQVKADHPRRGSVENCVVIRKHSSTAFDVRFMDGTIGFNIFQSQMILDTSTEPCVSQYEGEIGEYVMAWSTRFGRYCSACISAKCMNLYTVIFDYGEQKEKIPGDKITCIDDPNALSPTESLTNYCIDTIGYELCPIMFSVGEAVMARIHGSRRYYNGGVEAVNEQERYCVILFDSSIRDEHVPFSSIFSVDARHAHSIHCHSSSSGQQSNPNAIVPLGLSFSNGIRQDHSPTRRRHSASSVGSMILSVAGSIFRAKKDVERRVKRRGSDLITEIGAQVRTNLEISTNE